jgi:hypothetical protein
MTGSSTDSVSSVPSRYRSMFRINGRPSTENRVELVPAVGTQPGGSVPTVPTKCRLRYGVGSASTDVGADMCRPGPSGPRVGRRGTLRAARLCRYQICSSGIFRRHLLSMQRYVVVHKAYVTMQHIVCCAQRCLFDDTTLRSCRIVLA